MPRYYFDLRPDDEPWSDDEEGTVFADREAARAAALELAAGVMKDEILRRGTLTVRVHDEDAAEPFLVVTLSVSVEPPGKP